MKRVLSTLAVSLAFCLALGLTLGPTEKPGLAAPAGPTNTGAPLKIGFVLVGPASDFGYNYSHDQGRQYLQAHVKNIETTVAERIPESAEAERVMEKLIAKGNKLIYSTSYGYLEPAQRVAKRHKDVIIMQTWRPGNLPNMGCYAAYQYQPLYVVGMVAGKMTRKNSIGFVCAHPIPLLLQYINAFTLGARSVNPSVKVHVVWTNAWSDPATEAEAAKSLIDSGVDILGSAGDSSVTVTKAAEQSHVMTFATQADLQKFAPNYWLTGSSWNWNKIYCQLTEAVQNGSWKPETRWLGMSDGAVQVSSYGKLVPTAVKKEAESLAEQIKSGKLVVFKGPLKDREGKLRLARGEVASAKFLTDMDFFVDGVVGALPNKK